MKLELNLARDAKNNGKGFYRCVNQKRKVKEGVPPLINIAGKLVTMDKEKTEVLNNFFATAFNGKPLFPPLLSGWTARWGLGSRLLPTLSEDQVHDHLRKLNVHKSMGPDEMHPRVLREFGRCSHSPRYLKSPGSQIKSQVIRKRETLSPSLKRVERRTLGTSDLSASPLCLGKVHGTDPPRSYAKAHGGQGGDSGQPARLHQGQVLPDQPSGLLGWSGSISE
ncbi:hypothetical protein BTVI_01033 [Pitangus sulphuratus]|nr:hypothetical protein BTVI_59765 [Pitangus sulphuratus]KAJ7428287.1 hypothetical protein BTVI_01033 [Pitangus sulphuratus]